MSWIVNLAIFAIISTMCWSGFILPMFNPQIASTQYAVLRSRVNMIIEQNRNNPNLIKNQILALRNDGFANIVMAVDEKQENDFRVIDLHYRYSGLFQREDNIGEQVMSFLVNDV